MKYAVICAAAFFALGACGSEGDGGGYLPNSSPVGGGGQGGAPGGTVPPAGGGPGTVPPMMTTPPPIAGNAPVAGNPGTAGQPMTAAGQGSAGMTAGASGGAAGMSAAGMGGMSGMGGMAGMAGGAAGMGGGAPGGNTMGTVTVEFTTVTYGGEYAPLNYGAVWFETPSKMFIKTAKRWAGTTHASDLVGWTMASGGWGSIFGGGNTADMMDAVSSATIRTHQKHTVTWNLMNAQKTLVPDGKYVAVVEMSESRARDRAGPIMRIEFTKGPMPQMVMQPDMANFTGITLKYEPK